MASKNAQPKLSEAAGSYITQVNAEDGNSGYLEVHRFVSWFGADYLVDGLRAPEIVSYVERYSVTDAEYAQKLKALQAFLLFLHRQGWCPTNLATQVKLKRKKTIAKTNTALNKIPEAICMTPEGYQSMINELAQLKEKRIVLIDEIKKAAADKDFKENAPLHAAREQKGHVEGRIKELEEALKLVQVMQEKPRITLRVGMGVSVFCQDLNTEREVCYTIVSPREVDPANGKISNLSPIGKALVGREQGETIDIKVPSGIMRFVIKQIGR
jgi:transcription elongation factor GreA